MIALDTTRATALGRTTMRMSARASTGTITKPRLLCLLKTEEPRPDRIVNRITTLVTVPPMHRATRTMISHPCTHAQARLKPQVPRSVQPQLPSRTTKETYLTVHGSSCNLVEGLSLKDRGFGLRNGHTGCATSDARRLSDVAAHSVFVAVGFSLRTETSAHGKLWRPTMSAWG